MQVNDAPAHRCQSIAVQRDNSTTLQSRSFTPFKHFGIAALWHYNGAPFRRYDVARSNCVGLCHRDVFDANAP
jgi:hypothetical protein